MLSFLTCSFDFDAKLVLFTDVRFFWEKKVKKGRDWKKRKALSCDLSLVTGW